MKKNKIGIILALLAFVSLELFAQAPAYSSSDGFSTVFIWLIVIIIVFFLCRELICWYYKINRMISNQDEIIRLLRKIANESETPPTEPTEKKSGILKELSDSAKFMVSGK